MSRRYLVALALLALVLAGGIYWYLYRPEKKFVDDVVDEPFPGEVVAPGR
ncbi:MAG: hypothetical protein K2V38_10885 [Gemmataceae bacterium]|nr:hypothetical protein [Gemmataceae bacterium]